jgi:hypothetical protein
MSSSEYRPDPRRQGTAVRVVGCHTAMCSNLNGRQRMAVMTFSSRNQILEPYLLNVMQVHVLVRDLIGVLRSLEDRQNDWGGAAIADDLPSPSIPTPPPRQNRGKRVLPSRRPSSPNAPIQATEAWALHSILKNAKSHDDFLKLIGADTTIEQSTEILKKKAVAPDPTEPTAVRNERKRRRRRHPRAQRRKRKEK